MSGANETFEPAPGLPAPPEPDGGQPPVPPDGAGAEPEFEEFRVRDEVWRVPRDLAQRFADEMHWDTNRLREAIQVGVDGSRVYERVNRDREELEQWRQELAGIAAELEQRRGGYSVPAGYTPPRQPVQRPPAEDLTGTVQWLADQLERLGPLIETVPGIQQRLDQTYQTFEEYQRGREVAEERVVSLRDYEAVQAEWKRQGWGDLPPRSDLESYLRSFPLSDDVNKSWAEIWNDVGWILAGPAIARRQRRQAVLASQQPDATITVPGSRAPLTTPAPPGVRPLTGRETPEELEANIRALEGQIGNLTLSDLHGR